MSGRDIILGRIREALRISAPHPNADHSHSGHQTPVAPAEFEEWLPPGGSGREEQLELFARHSQALWTVFIRVASEQEMQERLQEMASAEKWNRVATHPGSLTDRMVPTLGLPLIRTTQGYDPDVLESCDAGITECDSLIAQTGSILLSSKSAGGRALSVLPPHHVVLAKESQILPDLAASLEQAKKRYGNAMPSYLGFVTGPSRTGDIERILVLGAHGPKRLTVLCLAD